MKQVRGMKRSGEHVAKVASELTSQFQCPDTYTQRYFLVCYKLTIPGLFNPVFKRKIYWICLKAFSKYLDDIYNCEK